MSGFVPPGPPPEPYPSYGSFRGGTPPQHDPSAHAEASQSRKMAGWALGLAFVFFVPLAPLLAGGLAIAVLVRAHGARGTATDGSHGRGMAVAALVVATLHIAGLIALVVTGAFNFSEDAERDDEGRVTEPTDIAALNLRVGDCANDPNLAELQGSETVQTFELEVVPCEQAHDIEAYHGFDLPEGDYPGRQVVIREAEEKCSREAVRFIGGTGRPTLSLSYYYPEETSWQLYDDRLVLCVIGETGEKTEGTLRGTGTGTGRG